MCASLSLVEPRRIMQNSILIIGIISTPNAFLPKSNNEIVSLVVQETNRECSCPHTIQTEVERRSYKVVVNQSIEKWLRSSM